MAHRTGLLVVVEEGEEEEVRAAVAVVDKKVSPTVNPILQKEMLSS